MSSVVEIKPLINILKVESRKFVPSSIEMRLQGSKEKIKKAIANGKINDIAVKKVKQLCTAANEAGIKLEVNTDSKGISYFTPVNGRDYFISSVVEYLLKNPHGIPLPFSENYIEGSERSGFPVLPDEYLQLIESAMPDNWSLNATASCENEHSGDYWLHLRAIDVYQHPIITNMIQALKNQTLEDGKQLMVEITGEGATLEEKKSHFEMISKAIKDAGIRKKATLVTKDDQCFVQFENG